MFKWLSQGNLIRAGALVRPLREALNAQRIMEGNTEDGMPVVEASPIIPCDTVLTFEFLSSTLGSGFKVP